MKGANHSVFFFGALRKSLYVTFTALWFLSRSSPLAEHHIGRRETGSPSQSIVPLHEYGQPARLQDDYHTLAAQRQDDWEFCTAVPILEWYFQRMGPCRELELVGVLSSEKAR
ncbi:hypothetical protein B0H11DRAFT_467543 [Mycena galericulata]|nr:hypothetical protein B0H11DRAFT_467543 [Mycena galericulata]